MANRLFLHSAVVGEMLVRVAVGVLRLDGEEKLKNDVKMWERGFPVWPHIPFWHIIIAPSYFGFLLFFCFLLNECAPFRFRFSGGVAAVGGVCMLADDDAPHHRYKDFAVARPAGARC